MHACMYVDCVCVYLYTNKDAAQTGIQTEALLKGGTHVCMQIVFARMLYLYTNEDAVQTGMQALASLEACICVCMYTHFYFYA